MYTAPKRYNVHQTVKTPAAVLSTRYLEISLLFRAAENLYQHLACKIILDSTQKKDHFHGTGRKGEIL
jgi:hypothetical protein